mgnify:FL=1|jgi:GTPase SAR1 family protein
MTTVAAGSKKQPPDFTIKFLLMGNKNAGKTALQVKYFDGKFIDYLASTGVNTRFKRLEI